MKVIKQYDESDCGPACLAMIAHYHKKKTLLSRIREWAKTNEEGTSLYGLIEAGKKLGIELTGVKADSLIDLESTELPMIAHIVNDKGFMHFVIIEKRKKKHYISLILRKEKKR